MQRGINTLGTEPDSHTLYDRNGLKCSPIYIVNYFTILLQYIKMLN